MDFPALDVIRVFEHDPDLLEGLAPEVARHVRARLFARRAWADPGPWEPEFEAEATVGHLGLLVIDGLLVRTVRLGGRECSEVVGPGDLLRPWDGDDPGASVDSSSEWRVLAPTTFAVLDPAFAARAARFPAIVAALLGRSARRCRALVYQATIAHVRQSDTRVLLALWQLADRWGVVTGDGVRVPVPLTHQLLAQITCLQRPTVSAAIGRLGQSRQVARSDDGGWLLHGEPPRLDGDGDGDPRGLAAA
jgi:CRP/FNR family transcriptional regulator, cyclic AMP receptor protein